MPKKTAQELALDLDKVLDGLIAGTITPAEARRVTRSSEAALRKALDATKAAKARGEKPDVPFFKG